MNFKARQAINRRLMGAGFSSMDEQGGRLFLLQCASLINNHDDYRRLLLKVHPSERANAYNSISPNLRFRPKPLDDYLMEERNAASDNVSHRLPAEIHTTREVGSAPQIVALEFDPEKRARLVCSHCFRLEIFFGPDRESALNSARSTGWTHEEEPGGPTRTRCPECREAVN